MLCPAAGWVKSHLRCLWCVESVLQVDHSLDLHLFSSWFFIWMLQDQALPIRKWMKSLIRALNGILETFVCTWGSMYAEIKQQPLLACFLCSYNLSSRLCFSYYKSLLYIRVYLFLFRNITCVCVCSSGESWPCSAQQSPTKAWRVLAVCPASAPFWLLLLWLGAFLGAYWPTCEFCGPFWVWSRAIGRSSLAFSWCPALMLLRSPSTLPGGPAAGLGHAPPLFPNKHSPYPERTPFKYKRWFATFFYRYNHGDMRVLVLQWRSQEKE